jgi:hypothetical protein
MAAAKEWAQAVAQIIIAAATLLGEWLAHEVTDALTPKKKRKK